MKKFLIIASLAVNVFGGLVLYRALTWEPEQFEATMNKLRSKHSYELEVIGPAKNLSTKDEILGEDVCELKIVAINTVYESIMMSSEPGVPEQAKVGDSVLTSNDASLLPGEIYGMEYIMRYQYSPIDYNDIFKDLDPRSKLKKMLEEKKHQFWINRHGKRLIYTSQEVAEKPYKNFVPLGNLVFLKPSK